jgi:hypothetical protein
MSTNAQLYEQDFYTWTQVTALDAKIIAPVETRYGS